MVTVLSSVFSFDVTKGKVAPGGSLRASVTYSPTVVDTVSVDYLCLKYRGALKKTQLKLTGKCIGKRHTHKMTKQYIVTFEKKTKSSNNMLLIL